MLKNKEQRKAFLLNEDNWSLVYHHPSIFTVVKQLILPDGTTIIRESILEYDEFNEYTAQYSQSQLNYTYRIVRSKYVTTSLSVTFLVEYMKKIKIPQKELTYE